MNKISTTEGVKLDSNDINKAVIGMMKYLKLGARSGTEGDLYQLLQTYFLEPHKRHLINLIIKDESIHSKTAKRLKKVVHCATCGKEKSIELIFESDFPKSNSVVAMAYCAEHGDLSFHAWGETIDDIKTNFKPL